jgi:hypothetical protein
LHLLIDLHHPAQPWCAGSVTLSLSLSAPQGVAGALFFWTYMLLVFLVLLNFLLAIIVDAFSEVRMLMLD